MTSLDILDTVAVIARAKRNESRRDLISKWNLKIDEEYLYSTVQKGMERERGT